MKREGFEKRFEKTFGEGRNQENEKAASEEKNVEMVEEVSRRETQFDEWEKMSHEPLKRQREDRGLNLF